MRYSYSIAFISMFLLAPVESAAQDEDSPFQHIGENFDERLEERGRVSGDIIMGVMIGPVPGEDAPPYPWADAAPRSDADLQVLVLPEPESDHDPQHICVRINSKDGRFEAENTYEVADGTSPDDAPIPYRGLYGPDVAQMLAVSLIKPGRCGDRTNIAIPSLWAASPVSLSDGALHIFINAAGNPTYVSFGAEAMDCQDVTDATTLKYTASCIITLAALRDEVKEGAVDLTVFVTRSLGEETFDVSVLLPPGLD